MRIITILSAVCAMACSGTNYWAIDVVVPPEVAAESEGMFLKTKAVFDGDSIVTLLAQIEGRVTEDLVFSDQIGVDQNLGTFVAWLDTDPEGSTPHQEAIQSDVVESLGQKGTAAEAYRDPESLFGTTVELILELP